MLKGLHMTVSCLKIQGHQDQTRRKDVSEEVRNLTGGYRIDD